MVPEYRVVAVGEGGEHGVGVAAKSSLETDVVEGRRGDWRWGRGRHGVRGIGRGRRCAGTHCPSLTIERVHLFTEFGEPDRDAAEAGRRCDRTSDVVERGSKRGELAFHQFQIDLDRIEAMSGIARQKCARAPSIDSRSTSCSAGGARRWRRVRRTRIASRVGGGNSRARRAGPAAGSTVGSTAAFMPAFEPRLPSAVAGAGSAGCRAEPPAAFVPVIAAARRCWWSASRSGWLDRRLR